MLKEQRHPCIEAGFSMIEVLVTIVVIAIGLLGLSGLHAKVSIMEMESYQRAQALALLEDMEDRIRGLRGTTVDPKAPPPGLPAAGTTITVGPGGNTAYDPVTSCASKSGSDLADCLRTFCRPVSPPPPAVPVPARTGADLEICDWSVALAGASETASGSTRTLGAMIGARGCIHSVTPTVPVAGQLPAKGEYYITVVWQGLVATADPDAGTEGETCAKAVANFGSGLRRFAATRVLVPYLDAI